MSLKIVLASLNAKYIHSSLALRYLRAYLNKIGVFFSDPFSNNPKIEVEIKEYSINNNLLDVLADIYPSQPDLIGLACYIWNMEETLKLAEFFKKAMPETKIALGGPEVSYDFSSAGHTAANYADYVILGEGEKTFAALTKTWTDRDSWHNIPGLLWSQDGRLGGNARPQIIENLDEIPFPYDHNDLANLHGKIIYYESSRGCPFSCRYCLSSATSGVRYFSLDRVMRDLEFFLSHDVAQVKFVDRTFNASKKHYLPILKFLAAQKCSTNFHFEVAADLWDDEGLEILRKAPPGRFQLEIGVQSTMPKTLQAVSRHNNFDAIAKNVNRIAQYGNIHLHLDLIAALPHESMEFFAKSFNNVYSLAPDMLQIGFLKLLKGSALRANSREHGYIFMDNPPYEVLSNNYISYEELRRLKLFEKVFNLTYNGGRFRHSLKWIVSQDTSPFSFYENLALFWEKQGFELVSHSQVSLYRFLADFCRFYRPHFYPVFLEFLKFDYLLSPKGVSRPEFLHFNDSPSGQDACRSHNWQEKKNSFWRDIDLVRRYLPDFSFTSWRDIKKNYHLEVFSADIPTFLQNKCGWENSRAAVLFTYKENGETNFQPIDEKHFQ